jgi:hypothetical protein
LTPRLPRRLALALVCGALLLLTWARASDSAVSPQTSVSFHKLEEGMGHALAPGLSVEGVWRIVGSGEGFGGYSGLAADPAGNLVAIGDGGARLDFSDPSRGKPNPRAGWLLEGPEVPKAKRDAEAVTQDPSNGRLWVAYEFRNLISRFDPHSADVERVRPKAMRDWGANSGGEAMARLPDGRFVLLAEMQFPKPRTGGPGLLFGQDPIDGKKPVEFRFEPPHGFFASDMAALPDGRVLILVRRLTFPFPPMFAAQVLIANPKTIRAGKNWDWRLLARIENPVPLDNYEGLAVVPREDGALMLWLISDDNAMATQRTLLLKLRWDWKVGTQKSARIAPRAS